MWETKLSDSSIELHFVFLKISPNQQLYERESRFVKAEKHWVRIERGERQYCFIEYTFKTAPFHSRLWSCS